jgi:hypothetical protein
MPCLVRLWPAEKASTGDVEVGVVVLVVGVGVVAAVLADPPAVAQADQAAVEEADGVVGAPPAEDLLVPGVVADERHVRPDHGQHHGREELPPGVAEERERGPGGGQRGERHPDLDGVVHRPPVEQARLADDAAQIGEVAAGAGLRVL